MDLSRAKTILIVSFLILNVFLSVRLWQRPQYLRLRGGLTAEEAEVVRETLSEAGFELTAAIPRQVPRLSLLHVARLSAGEVSWPFRFWGEEPAGRMGKEPGSLIYAKGHETLEISRAGHVVFRRGGEAGLAEESRQLADRFLRDRGIWEDNLKLDITYQHENGTSVYRYLQTYHGFPLFMSSVEAMVTSSGPDEVRIKRVVPLKFSGKEVQVVSALVAARTLVQQPGDFTGKKIVDISLGYYSQDYNADRWEVVPVWRFAASDGSSFYVNAFNGEVEHAL